MLVESVRASPIRSLSDVTLRPAARITAIWGPNGSGKTNLLEALYFALTGRSFRTSDRRKMIPWGESLARSEAAVIDDQGIRSQFRAVVTRTEGRRFSIDGEQVETSVAVSRRPHVLVFSPDRLGLIKGPPSERRAHLDAFTAARRPVLASLRADLGSTLAQRNAMLSRVAKGEVSAGGLDVWDSAFASVAAALCEARGDSISLLASAITGYASDLGLPGELTITYSPRAPGSRDEIRAGLRERREADIGAGRSTWGPHLDEVKLEMDGRSVRDYGSQGQQRTTLLALLFSERDALERVHVPPLFLLDDVMSEFDPDRRDLLGERLSVGGQSLITAADRDALPSQALEDSVAMRSGEIVDDG